MSNTFNIAYVYTTNSETNIKMKDKEIEYVINNQCFLYVLFEKCGMLPNLKLFTKVQKIEF